MLLNSFLSPQGTECKNNLKKSKIAEYSPSTIEILIIENHTQKSNLQLLQ